MSEKERSAAAEQLAAFEQVKQGMTSANRRGARQLGAMCMLLGVILGTLHALLYVFTPQQSLTAFFVLCGSAVLAVMMLSVGYQAIHRVLPHGYGKKYTLCLMLSIGLYALALTLIATPMAWPLVVLLGIAVALPLLIGGLWMVRR